MSDERVHDDWVKAPFPVAAHVIVPVGASPLTVAMHVEAKVTIAGEGVQEIEVVETLGAKGQGQFRPAFVLLRVAKGHVRLLAVTDSLVHAGLPSAVLAARVTRLPWNIIENSINSAELSGIVRDDPRSDESALCNREFTPKTIREFRIAVHGRGTHTPHEVRCVDAQNIVGVTA